MFTVSIVNDTGRAVVVRDCSHFCSSSLITFDLGPGESAAVHRTTNEHKYFSVTTTSGGHIGCVDLFFEQPRPGAQVDVSHARGCPSASRPWKTLGSLVLLLLVLVAIVTVIVMRPAHRPSGVSEE